MLRTSPLPKEFYIKNRQRYSELTKPNSISVFHSNSTLPTNADGNFRFKQNSDLFYLTGIDQEDTILLLCPDFPNRKMHEILFIKETSDHIRIWEGEKLSIENARELSGIQEVKFVSQFDSIFERMVFAIENIYINQNQHGFLGFKSNDILFLEKCKSLFPLHRFERAAPLLESMRVIKTPEEQQNINQAVKTTKLMFERAAKATKPGVYEYEIEAEITHELLMNRGRTHAFEPIVASGKNACSLHYVTNNGQLKNGDLLLLDIGAEFGNYNADLTRTIPINGRFSEKQKKIYNAVLRVMKFTSKQMFVGNTFEKMNLAVAEMMENELLELGYLKQADARINSYLSDKPAYKKYFPHGVAHFLGIDVHDVGSRFEPFKVGMVLTNEPGIYIQEEGIGIRIENDILILENGVYDFMHDFATEIEEIEDLMNKK